MLRGPHPGCSYFASREEHHLLRSVAFRLQETCKVTAASPRGWKDILLRVYRNVSDHRVPFLGAGITYYSFLAILPALAALVAIYGLFFDPATITAHLDRLSGLLPGGPTEVAREQLTRVASKGRQTLGLTSFIGLAVSLWSVNAAMKSLFDTLNIIYGEGKNAALSSSTSFLYHLRWQELCSCCSQSERSWCCLLPKICRPVRCY